MTINEAIRKACELSGKTNQDLAALAGLPPARLSEYKRRVEPSANRLATIEQATGCQIRRTGGEWTVTRTG